MEPSNVLIALEEWEKWRSRKARLERELEDLRRKQAALRAELDNVKKEISAIEEALLEPGERSVSTYSLPPFDLGR
jgi:predicted  nucleic acid-binding Zn-ribbon protein